MTDFETLTTSDGQLVLLTATDFVKDRLASFFHWNDIQALQQAVMVCRDQKVNLQEIERWAHGEKQIEKFHEFIKQL